MAVKHLLISIIIFLFRHFEFCFLNIASIFSSTLKFMLEDKIKENNRAANSLIHKMYLMLFYCVFVFHIGSRMRGLNILTLFLTEKHNRQFKFSCEINIFKIRHFMIPLNVHLHSYNEDIDF
jgi:hypothetical protein